MAALDTVQDYVTTARVLVQDQVVPYRYTDSELVTALNLGILDARRSRPDLFLTKFATIPFFTAVDTTPVPIEPMYRPAFLYYMCGHAHLRDEESPEDSRAAAFMAKFSSTLLGLS